MRKLIFAAIALFSFSTVMNAQRDYGEDSVTCSDNLHIYYSLAKQKNYAQAFDAWKVVYDTCPQSSKNNFIFAPYIIKSKMQETESEERKEELVDLLLESYDKRLQYYPGKEDYVKGKKALDMLKYKDKQTRQAYRLFEEAFNIGGAQQSAAFYNGYFIAAARLFNADTFEVTDVFNAYNVVIEGIEVNSDALNKKVNELQKKKEEGTINPEEEKELAKAQRELKRYNKVASNINKILAPIATCDKLKLLYNDSTFEQHKNDKVWLQRAVKMLQKERKTEEGEAESCTDNPVFFKAAEALYKMEPTAKSARAMGILSIQRDSYEKATNYLKKAIEMEVDPLKNADNHYKLAQVYFQRGILGSAKAEAVKAGRKQSGWGDPYVLMAQIYAAGDGPQCGSNVFEKKAVYWAAIDKLRYAKSIDSSVSGKANRLISSYKEQLPDKSVIFQLSVKEGDTYTIGCYINETITVQY